VRISFINSAASLGGAERSLLDIFAALQQHPARVALHLIAPGDGPLVERARALGVATTVVPMPPVLSRVGDSASSSRAGRQRHWLDAAARVAVAAPATLHYVGRIKDALAAHRPDIVHANGFKAQVLASLAKPRDVPAIWHVHDYVSDRPVTARLLRLLRSRCALLVSNSRSVQRDAAHILRGAVRHEIVYNAIDVDYFSPRGPQLDLDALSGLQTPANGTIRVGLVGTFARWKGHDVFLRAVGRLRDLLPVRGYVIGAPVYLTRGSQWSMDELRAQARGLGLDRYVGFTGFIEDRAAAYRALDVVVHASTEPEPFGLTIAEAMACGKPIVVSAAGGALELISPGENAFIHSPGDPISLAERVRTLADDPALRARLGAAARVTAAARFNRHRLARDLTPVYESVIGRAFPSPGVAVAH
jgi:glycosyltransferase involved in cell wall biosynthesis